MEILADKELMDQVRQGIKEYKAGKGISAGQARKSLGLRLIKSFSSLRRLTC
jgi:hypothetical protein